MRCRSVGRGMDTPDNAIGGVVRVPDELPTSVASETNASNGSLRVIDVMAAMKGSDSNLVETSSLDQTQDCILLLWRRDSIIVPSTKINWRSEKIRARLALRVSVAQVIFVDTG